MMPKSMQNKSASARQRVLRARMAATRAELSAANHVVETTRQAWRSRNPSAALIKLPTLAGSSGLALALTLVGFVVVGPRKVLSTVIRVGTLGLITRAVRSAIRW
jgi:hypothetical protein